MKTPFAPFLLLACLATSSAYAAEPAFLKTTLYTFKGFPGVDGLVQTADGTLYGTTYGDTENSVNGSLFSFTLPKEKQAGEFKQLHSFVKGGNPLGLMLDKNGNMYGTTAYLNSGMIFSYFPGQGNPLRIVYGAIPIRSSYSLLPSNLMQASDGHFYGTTQTGGKDGKGTIYRLVAGAGMPVVTVLHDFNGTDGETPMGGLVQGRDGNLYGVTSVGGKSNNESELGRGTFFMMTLKGEFKSLYSFKGTDDDGTIPRGIIQNKDGDFYGISGGGKSTSGTVFHITAKGELKKALKTFTDGIVPRANLIQANDGYFYGTTMGNSIFEYEPKKATIYRVNSEGKFDMLFDDVLSNGVIQGSDGNFYGATTIKGDSVLFKLTAR